MKIWKGETLLQLFASAVWNSSEFLRIPLGRLAPVIFGWMMGCKKQKQNKN